MWAQLSLRLTSKMAAWERRMQTWSLRSLYLPPSSAQHCSLYLTSVWIRHWDAANFSGNTKHSALLPPHTHTHTRTQATNCRPFWISVCLTGGILCEALSDGLCLVCVCACPSLFIQSLHLKKLQSVKSDFVASECLTDDRSTQTDTGRDSTAQFLQNKTYWR